MRELKPFYVNAHELMSYNVDGKPLFRANDVASILDALVRVMQSMSIYQKHAITHLNV